MLLLIGLLFGTLGTFDPDFDAYRLIFDAGGAWLAEQGRDPLFVYFTSLVSSTFSYEQFRFAVCALFGIGLLLLALELEKTSPRGFGFVQAFSLTPLVLLKFHVQIREGIALLMWLLVVTSGIPARSVRFWIFGAISSLTHVAVLPLWGAAALIRWSSESHYGRDAAITFCLFALYGLASLPGMSELVLSPFISTEDIIRDTGYGLEISGAKLGYWGVFVVLPATALLFFARSAWNVGGSVSPYGMVGTYGLLGFFPIAALGGALLGIGEGQFANTLRIGASLMALLGLQLSVTRPKHPITWAVMLFAIADAMRVLLVQ